MNAELESLLLEKTSDELKKMAMGLEPYIKVPPALANEGKLRELIILGVMKRQKALEQRAQDEAQAERQEKLGADALKRGHPSPETTAIRNSPKVYTEFMNMENPGMDGEAGADVKFTVGEKFTFHLWDGQEHVLPRVLIADDPCDDAALLEKMTEYWRTLKMTEKQAAAQARNHLRTMSLSQRCVYPIFEMRQDPTNPNRMVPRHVRNAPRFVFRKVRPAPDDAEYGIVIKEPIYGTNT